MLVPPGDPAFVTCHWGENYQFQQLHFSYGPYSTFDDPLPGLDSLCVDLEFEGRTRPNTIPSGDVPMPLEQQSDAVGALLLLTNDGTLTPTDSAFVYSEEYPASSGVNLYVQHWRHIAPPCPAR